jgi:hypothetical protein
VLDGSSLDLLQPEELELLVVGSPILDFAALQRYARASYVRVLLFPFCIVLSRYRLWHRQQLPI